MIDEIKNKIDIVDFVSSYIILKGSGNYYKGLCPFHNEKTPSFFVSPEKQIFKCFGCNEWGSVIDFFMKMENVDFKEALRTLAERAGIEIKEFSGAIAKERNIILEMNRVALRFFRNQLKENKSALEYLINRGLSKDMIDYFELGYAPTQNELRDYLFALGYSLRDMQFAGLLTYGKEDRFQQRIVYPFVDHYGKIIGFTGRIYPDKNDVAKYLNTPETQLFKKSQFLYGLYYAIPHIKSEKQVIVVEGQMDFLACWQNGIKNVVAISGIAFTDEQLKILKRYTKKIVFALDEDEAGLIATLKSTPLALKSGFEIEKLIFSHGKDLDEFLSSIKDVSEYKLKTSSLIEYLFDYGLKNFDLKSANGKRKFLELLLPQIKQMDLVQVSYWISKIVKITDINEGLLYKELEKIQLVSQARNVNEKIDNSYKSKITQGTDDKFFGVIEKLLAVILALKKIELFDDLKEYLNEKSELVEKIKNNVIDEEVEILRLRASYEEEINQNLEDELRFLVKELKKEYFKRKIYALKYELNIKNDNEAGKILETVREYTSLLKEL
ncbi:MAG: DNA primase [Patescibacteria group bacterium]